jgi:hypothetical protein
MSSLTDAERRTLEDYLGMKSGHVLNFSDRDLTELVFRSAGITLFDPRYAYKTGSKANRLRAIWTQEDDLKVARILRTLLECMNRRSAAKGKCERIIDRLERSSPVVPEAQNAESTATACGPRIEALQQLQEQLDSLATDANRQRAGLALEKLLNKLFQAFDMAPRKSFRVDGEQIDGSFHFEHNTYLLEAKWTTNPVPAADLYVFQGKLAGKAPYARGLFISLNGATKEAREAITQGKAASFIAMDGYDLRMILSGEITLTMFLHERTRLFAEDGRVFVPFSELRDA